jgi:proteic killer suppression protein
VIQSFRDEDTQELFESGRTRRWKSIEKVALRKLDYLDQAVSLNDLKSPPGNRLEALSRDRDGQHSIRIQHSIRSNDRYRICFVWAKDGAHAVEVTDYH